MSRKKIVFIVNPISGTGKQKLIEKKLPLYLNADLFEFHIEYTQHQGHGIKLAKQYIEKDFDIIAAVGGDGSVNEIGSALVHSGKSLAIIPTGSGNGLARHLKIPLRIEKAIERINDLNEIIIDTGKLNEEVFLCVCGFGFDALIAHKFSEQNKRGLNTYIKTVRENLFSYKPQKYIIQTETEKIETEAFILSVANGNQYGNNIFINPAADLTDGILNLTLIKSFKKYQVPGILMRMRTGSIHKSVKFENYNFKRAEIILESDLAQIDGEKKVSGLKAIVEIVPASLKVCC